MWYYAAHGESSKRGLVEWNELLRMARDGRVQPNDLVWGKRRGRRWLPARTVDGLFARADHAREPAPERPMATISGSARLVDPLPEQIAAPPTVRHGHASAGARLLTLVLLALLGCGIYAWCVYAGVLPPPLPLR